MALPSTLSRGATLARIGAAAVQTRRGDASQRARARAALSGLLANARGTPMKVGQLLAGRHEEFEVLTRSIEPLPLETVQSVLRQRYGRDPCEMFANIHPSEAAASLGQVHRAELVDGRQVAVKVRYPGIEDAVEAEVKLLGLMPGLGPVRKWGMDLDGYRRMFRDNLDRELDYQREASAQERFRRRLLVDGLRIPQAHLALCTDGVLVQQWVQGQRLEAARDWDFEARRAIAEILLETTLASIFRAGEVHTDPHAGNYLVQRHPVPTVTLLDFGCTVEVPRPARLSLLKLILAAREGSEVAPLEGFAQMGFDAAKLAHIGDTLPVLCGALFRPFTAGVFDVKTWRLSERCERLLGDLRWWFRAAGPPDLFLLMRAFSGVAHQLAQLDVRLDWFATLQRAAGPDTLRQARELTWPSVSVGPRTFAQVAGHLRVEVREGRRQVASVTLPSGVLDNLQEVIPPEVLQRLAERRVSVDALVREAASSRHLPHTLFALDAGDRSYRVWLE